MTRFPDLKSQDDIDAEQWKEDFDIGLARAVVYLVAAGVLSCGFLVLLLVR